MGERGSGDFELGHSERGGGTGFMRRLRAQARRPGAAIDSELVARLGLALADRNPEMQDEAQAHQVTAHVQKPPLRRKSLSEEGASAPSQRLQRRLRECRLLWHGNMQHSAAPRY